jgi:hypothetical protein
MTVLVLPIPGACFDFASFVFHVPTCALAAKPDDAATNDRATNIAAIREFIMPAIPSETPLGVNSNQPDRAVSPILLAGLALTG